MRELTVLHYLPILTTVLSVLFAHRVYQRYRTRGGTYLRWWSAGILIYGLGTFAEAWMTLLGWNAVVFKFWYVVGALMGGAPLAQGTVWLLLRPRTATWLTRLLVAAVGVAALCAVLSPIEYTLVDPHVPSGSVFTWQWVRLFSPFINTYAVIFLIGGALYSALRFRRAAAGSGTGSTIARDRFVGNLWIAVGAILPGIGGGASRMGHTEILYLGEFVGILLIWLGYWFNVRRRPILDTSTSPLFASVASLLLVAVTALPASALAATQAAQGVITVAGPDGSVMADVPVELRRGDELLLTATTGADGKLRLDSLAAGGYTVMVRVEGFQAWHGELRLANGTVELGIRLQLAPLEERTTVAATKTSRSIEEVPGEVAVVERQDLEHVQARSLEDAFRYIPGVEMAESVRRLGQTPNIRGFDDQRVLTLRDGARVAQFNSGHRGTQFFDIEDVQRIEVVKGPASALYGSGAIGGVVSITTRDPGDLVVPGRAWGVSLRTAYSSAYSEFMATPRVFGRTGTGVGWLVSYTGRRNDGTVRLAGEPAELSQAEEDVDSFSGRLTAPIGSGNLLRVSVDRFEQNGASSANLALVDPGPAEIVDRATTQTAATVRFARSGRRWFDRDLSATAYWNDVGIDETRSVDGRVDAIGYQTWGVDARNTTRWGRSNTITYGFEAVSERQQATRRATTNDFFPDGRRDILGAYVQDEITLLDGRLALVPGLRFDHWTSRPEDHELDRQSFDRVSPKLGATYEFAEQLTASGSYGQGFRAPYFQELFLTGTHFAFPLPGDRFFLALFLPNEELRPETSRNLDLGLRYRSDRFAVRAAYWRARVEDFIELLPVFTSPTPPTGGTQVQLWQALNRQDARLRGFEAGLDWQVGDGWLVRGAYSNSRGEDRTTGEPLLQVPASKLALGIEWSQVRAGTRLSWNTRVYGSRSDVPTGVDPSDGYVLHDVQISWTARFLQRVTLFLGVNNLANRQYENPRFGSPGVGRDLRIGIAYGQ